MFNNLLIQFGFNLNENSTHTARTIMLNELTILLDWVSKTHALRSTYISSILEDNCLQKRSISNRKITTRHLIDLYSLDTSTTVFRSLRYLWSRDEISRPLLAYLCASTRDSILHDMAMKVVELPIGARIASEDTSRWLDEKYAGRFSKVTVRSIAKNLNSTWTQAGYLEGKVTKSKTKPIVAAGSVAYALFLAYLSGSRGTELFESKYVKMLNSSTPDIISLAHDASQRGWITFNRIGDVVDIRFTNFLNQLEMEWVLEQNR